MVSSGLSNKGLIFPALTSALYFAQFGAVGLNHRNGEKPERSLRFCALAAPSDSETQSVIEETRRVELAKRVCLRHEDTQGETSQ